VNTLLALLAALLGFGSCAMPMRDGDVTGCALEGPADPVRADVDGDGREDLVLHHLVAGRPTVEVCVSGDGLRTAPGYGRANLFFVVDVDGDGASEVLAGEDTGMAQTAVVLRWDGSGLAPVGVTVRNGTRPGDSEPRYLFGCAPGALVQADVDWARRTGVLTTYTIGDSGVSTSRRDLRVPAGATRETYLPTIVTPCRMDGRTPKP
jgi:hypothetical protein